MTSYRVLEQGARCLLGEGPHWSVRKQALLWVDSLGSSICRFRPTTGSVDRWQMPGTVAWIIERMHAVDFVVGLQKEIVQFDLESGTTQPLLQSEPHLPENRLNDAKVDPRGSLWYGTMPRDAQADTGGLYRLDPDGGLTRHDGGYRVSNGPAFAPDGRFLYHTDSMRALVYRFELSDTGELSNRTVFLRLNAADGYPDGMTVDSEGCLWVAFWGGSRVSRYSVRGELVRSIALPASQITSCAFGGADMDRLYVTSAATGVEGEQFAGALFEVDPQVRGLSPNLFGG
jgi:sugar lactone lactonase YvrE